jgi:hypothetical protein
MHQEGEKKRGQATTVCQEIQGVRVLEHYGTTTLGMRGIAQLYLRNDEMRLMGGVQVF